MVKGLLGKQDSIKQIEDSINNNSNKMPLGNDDALVKAASSISIQSMKRSFIGQDQAPP